MEPARILVVDDELPLLRGLARVLGSARYEVLFATDARQAFEAARSRRLDLILLDWTLPDSSGLDVLRGFRALGIQRPIMMVTGRTHVEDKVLAFESGADDYIEKPFDTRELLARVAAHLRRTPPALASGSGPLLRVDEQHRRVFVDGTHLAVSPIQYRILLCLWRKQDEFVSPANLIDFVWGADLPCEPRHCINVHVSALRARLGPARAAIRTVRGEGFILCVSDLGG